ncbi:MAG: hypothetical protein V6Z86_06040 [Hyphomicrobiales bacterium]
MSLDPQRLALHIAERLREIATRQGNVPFGRAQGGTLRKSHIVEPYGRSGARLAANTPYARAVHDGRPAIVIKPRRKKALYWPKAAHPVKAVRQPARRPNPWLMRAVKQLEREGLDFLRPEIGQAAVDDLERGLRRKRLIVKK